MARRRNNRRGSNFSTYFVVFIATCILGYVGYAVYGNFVERTAVIETGNTSTKYTAQAVVVRNETLTDTEGLTTVKYYADEGELIYKGTKIAEVYSSGYSQTDMNKLLSTRSDIKAHVKKMLASEYSDAPLERLDKQALDFARELGMMVRGKAEGNILNLERQMSAALNRRQQHFRDNYTGKDSTLKELYNQESTLQKKIQNWTTTYLADEDCIVSFYTDGWENVFAYGNFDEIPASQVHGVLTGESPPLTTSQRGRTSVFRKVVPNGWHLLLVSNDKNWNPVIGQSYKVQLRGFEGSVVDGLVTSVARSGNELLVRMQVEGSVRPVLNVRATVAEVSDSYISGLKVPVNALMQQGGAWGVVLTDSGGMFAPVDIIWQDNNYAIISSQIAGALYEGQKIRVF